MEGLGEYEEHKNNYNNNNNNSNNGIHYNYNSLLYQQQQIQPIMVQINQEKILLIFTHHVYKFHLL